jgi:hypothetical protein
VTAKPSAGSGHKYRAFHNNSTDQNLSGVVGRAEEEEGLLHFPPESLVRYLEAVAERKEALAPTSLDRKVDTRV